MPYRSAMMIVADESFRGSLLSQDAVGGNTEISCLHITFSIQDNNGFTPWLPHELQAMYKGRFLLQAPTQGGTLNEKKAVRVSPRQCNTSDTLQPDMSKPSGPVASSKEWYNLELRPYCAQC